ncbi:MAG: ABC transporter ATP-binding protein, partial [Hyphomicrobiales bacterium]|nr:ABC transporter ATP-binding protein [Hyphomicrobiales bacterium]
MTAELDIAKENAGAGQSPALDTVLTRIFGIEAGPWLAISVRPALPALALLFGLAMISAGAALVPPYLTKLIIDDGLVAGNADRLILWSAAFFTFGLAALGLGAFNGILHLRFSARMLADIRRRVLANLFLQSPRQHARMRTGEVMSRLDGDAGEVQQFLFNAALTGSGSALRLVGGAVMLFVLEWRLALIAVLLAPVELAFFAWARPRTEARAREVRSARGRLAARIAETAAGLPVIQSLTAEARIGRVFGDEQDLLIDRLERA